MALQPPETLFEEDALDASRLRELFADPSVFLRLAERGVLRPQPDGSCKIRFVGVATAGGRTFQILPKIFAGQEETALEVMRQVVRALRRYSAWIPPQHEDAPLLRASSQATGISAISLSDWLIRDYLAQGIYRRSTQLEDRDGGGQILWSRTIDRADPIFVSGRPRYISFVTRASARDSEHFVSRLHRHLVELALARYGHLLGYGLISLGHEPFEPFAETPPKGLSLAQLRKEIREAYTDRAIRLIPMLIALLEEIDVPPAKEISLYGTTTFHSVWERICGVLIGNEVADWQPFMPRPKWIGEAGEEERADTFVPDVVTSFQKDGEKWLLIADAKYYKLRLPPGLRNSPGVNDVAKQLWYENCLSSVARAQGYGPIANVFVVPGSPDALPIRAGGAVTLKSFSNNRVGIVWLAALDAIKRFADGETLDGELVASACAEAMSPKPALMTVGVSD